jgi:diguanylate cyclase (GGDEF)-like protein
MRLTKSSFRAARGVKAASRSAHLGAALIAAIALLAVFLLDRATGDSPVQHLYYLPIIFASVVFGQRGGAAASLAAIALYHFANHVLYASGRGEADVIQIALFVAVGVVTAKLASDAQRLRLLAGTDDLTGLHNLRSFEACLAALLQTAQPTRAPLSLLMLDVDHLKAMNDCHGHLAGAEAVRTVGGIIAAELPPDGVACRYGGDEFVVALPGCTTARAEEFGDRLRRAVNAASPVLAGHDLPPGTLSISIGVASRSCLDPACRAPAQHGIEQEGEALFRAADEALYRAKAAGRNRVCSA